MNRLTGKVAFVTGAAGGIGSAICDRFLAEGAFVAATDLHEASAKEAIGSAPDRAIAFACDVTSSEAVRDGIARTVKTFGKLDVLCNVAGGATPQDGKVTEVAEEEFWRTIKLNLFGTFLCCKFGIAEMLRTGSGSVINFSSLLTLIATPGRACYSSAKGGVSALTRQVAAEYGRQGIRVNAIAPGRTLTPHIKAMLQTEWGQTERVKGIAAKHLLGLVDPSDVADMAVFLASDKSRKVTGQILPVDSGASIV